MKKRESMTLRDKITLIKKTVPTFTEERAMECTIQEIEDLLTKVANYEIAKMDLELMIKSKNY